MADIQTEVNRRKQQSQQPRQLLSCTKCRERKVKCDRTKPCSACCARGAPRDCVFIAENGDYAPIQQSYELRKLRAENLRLKQRLRLIEGEESDYTTSPDSQFNDQPRSSLQKRRTAMQKRFQSSEWQDSIYFGSPGLATVISDFASVHIDPSVTLAHVVPRGPDMYASHNMPTYFAPTIFRAAPDECIVELLSCLPGKEEIFEHLTAFERRVNVCSFPHVPMEITRSEVERFLVDSKKNAQACPDMLALLFAAIATAIQHSIWDTCDGEWVANVMEAEAQKINVYIAAAMQALRLASFMHKPSLLGIQSLIMIGACLTNSGRFLDAFTLFGTTIRLAHSIGLHRHPKYLDPSPPTQRERSIIWWWMLRMDEELSMTILHLIFWYPANLSHLGRPLGISGIGDCPFPDELSTDPTMLRFGEFVSHFTILARRILSSDRLSNSTIDDFTDALKELLETMPEKLQFDKFRPEAPDWPLSVMATVYYCKTHTYLILLNRQRIEKSTAPSMLSSTKSPAPSFRAVNRNASSHPSPTTSSNTSLRGRALVLASSEDLLSAFIFLYHREPASLIDWTMGQQAFNSCMILLLDALEYKTLTAGIQKVEVAFAIFRELADNNVHKLAELAIERISWGLQELHNITTQPITPQPPISGGAQAGRRMLRTGQCEATRTTRIKDTVMGNTGMFLVEDCGLQAFKKEPYSPLNWGISDVPKEPKSKPEAQQHMGGRKPEGLPNETFRSAADIMQGSRRSSTLRLPITRYATRADADPMQPPSYTAPASPAHFAVSRQAERNVDRQAWQMHKGYHHVGPPHLNSSEAAAVAGVEEASGNASGWEYENSRWRRPSDVQFRHNSCPTLPHTAATNNAPVLRPVYSSPSSGEHSPTLPHAYYHPQPPLGFGTPSTQPAAAHVPMSSIAEAPGYPQGSFPGQQQAQMRYAFGSGGVSSSSSSTLTPLTENTSMEWRGFVGGDASG